MKPEAGRTYRLVRDFEVHDEKTGTLRHLLRRGEVVKVKRLEAEMDRVYLEGVQLPAALGGFSNHIQPVEG